MLVTLLVSSMQTFAHMILKSFQNNFFKVIFFTGTTVYVASLTDVFATIFEGDRFC